MLTTTLLAMSDPQTFWTAVGAIATVVGAAGAVVSLWQIRKDSRDRTRPVMVAELRPGVLTSTAELYVRNAGASVAKDVTVTFDPPLPVLEGADAERMLTPFLQRRYAKPIKTFTPGMELDNIWKSAGIRDEPVPDDFTVHFNYRDDRGRSYSDEYDLSVGTLQNQTGSYPSGEDDGSLKRRTIKALEAIARGTGRH